MKSVPVGNAGQYVRRMRRCGAFVCGTALSLVANELMVNFAPWTCIGPFGSVLIVGLGVWALGSSKLRAPGAGLLVGSVLYFAWLIYGHLRT